MSTKKLLEGSMAIAEAIQAARVKVIAAYPITPQTHVTEFLAQKVVNGELDAQYLKVDSEFSAISAIYGSEALGVRSYTASSSQGLLLMTEVLYQLASARLPAVITGMNRSISNPINIQPDHQDTITFRDTGMIQVYVEDSQDAYNTHLQAFKIAEDHEVLLPVLVAADGWTISHTFEPVELLAQQDVDAFLPPYAPYYPLDPKKPLTYGAIGTEHNLMEFRYMHHQALLKAKTVIEKAAEEFRERFGWDYGGLIQEYKTDEAEIILVAMGSMVGTIKDAIDEMREDGLKVGLLKIRCYRPFPEAEIRRVLSKAKMACVLDRSISLGCGGPLALEVKAALFGCDETDVMSFMAGLGGKDVTVDSIKRIVEKAGKVLNKSGEKDPIDFVNLNSSLI